MVLNHTINSYQTVNHQYLFSCQRRGSPEEVTLLEAYDEMREF